MVLGRLISLLVVLAGLSLSAHIGYAFQQNAEQKDVDQAIQKFLSSQKSEGEEANSQDSVVIDLNGDGKSEIVLVWTVLGPTYWRNNLTVFTRSPTGYKPVASLPLNGEAKLSSAKGGIIFVDEKLFARNDPLCCPSIKKRARYRWLGKKISEVKR